MTRSTTGEARGARATSIDKALEVCELLSASERGVPLSEIARGLKLPAPTAHRLLGVLRRRGYVRQDEESGRYGLTLKMLDLSFRLLGRSELRLHAYPVVREYVLRTGRRAFVAAASGGEVTYVWSTGPDAVAMHTVYGRQMPAHCALYLDDRPDQRRLSCLKLSAAADVTGAAEVVVRFGAVAETGKAQRLACTCAPVVDYSGREVARVGVFGHVVTDETLIARDCRDAWDLARLVSMRLGHLPAASLAVTA